MIIYCIAYDDQFDSVWVSLITEDKTLFEKRWKEIQEEPGTDKENYYYTEWENGEQL